MVGAVSAVYELELEVLDQLVLEHIEAEHKEAASPDKTLNQETKLSQIRNAICDGDIQNALQCIDSFDPAFLADHPALLFHLKLQGWIELLRQSQERDSDQEAPQLQKAVAWLRQELAPFALGAYPEAFKQFQAALPLLLASSCEPVSMEVDDVYPPRAPALACHWSLERRRQLAGEAVLLLRNRHNLLRSRLESMVRYLLQLSRNYVSETGFAPTLPDEAAAGPGLSAGSPGAPGGPFESPFVQSNVQQVLIGTRDAPLPAVDGSPTLSQSEANVQALAQVLGYGRQDAVNLVRAANNDALKALRLGLQTLHINHQLLLQFVLAYAAERLATAGDIIDSLSQTLSTSQSPCKRVHSPSKQEALTLHSAQHDVVSPILDDMQRGAADAALTKVESSLGCVASLRDHDPGLFFAWGKVEFLRLLSKGCPDEALSFARSRLAPAVTSHQQLLPQYRQLTAGLLSASQENTHASLLAATAELRLALQQVVAGQTGPGSTLTAPAPAQPLVQLLQCLLEYHRRWHALQHCRDSFATGLGLDFLVVGGGGFGEGGPSRGSGEVARASSRGQTRTERRTDARRQARVAGSAPRQSTTADVMLMSGLYRVLMQPGMQDAEEAAEEPEEVSIQQVVEFSQLSRAAALDLLRAHGGDPAAALAHLFT